MAKGKAGKVNVHLQAERLFWKLYHWNDSSEEKLSLAYRGHNPVYSVPIRVVLVLLESLASGHKVVAPRLKVADKMETIRFDPYVQQKVLYREVKKVKTLSS